MIEIVKEITQIAYGREFLPLKILSIIASVFFIGVIIYAKRATGWARIGSREKWSEFWSAEPYEKTLFIKKWDEIKGRLGKGWDSEGKLAIIEADALLNKVLESLAYGGDDMGERLKNIDKGLLPNLDDVWGAHKLRNDIVHDPDYHLNSQKIYWAIGVYEKAFEHLNAI